MVEVFRTNVDHKIQADVLLDLIHNICTGYEANFDLEDCDRILRVECKDGTVRAEWIKELLKKSGYHAEVLPDLKESSEY
jgi:hypothetical protein